MSLKKNILNFIELTDLKAAADALGITGVDRRSNSALRQALSRSRHVTAKGILGAMPEVRVKRVCEHLGINPTGRKAQLIHRLVDGDTSAEPVAAMQSDAIPATVAGSPHPPTPVKIDVTKTELVWPGKYNEDGTLKEAPRVSLPFQIIETVNESRATREVQTRTKGLPLFDVYEGSEGDTFEDGWKNKLIWGDNLLVMGSLLEKFAGKIDLIYIDPPFATGADFSFTAEIGDSGEQFIKEQSIIEEKAYRDTWGQGIGSYLGMIYARLTAMKVLLKPTGSIYVHLDPTICHYVKGILDDVFGPASFQREIVWRIGWISGYKSAAKNWIRNHDVILFYVKTPKGVGLKLIHQAAR